MKISPVVRKTAMGVMLAASTMVGINSCKSKPEHKLDQVSYEVNTHQYKQFEIEGGLDSEFNRARIQEYEKNGTYHGTINVQRDRDCAYLNCVRWENNNLGHKWKVFSGYNNAYWRSHEVLDYEKQTKDMDYRELALSRNGVATAENCSKYLDRMIAGSNISMAEYEQYEREVEAFKKAQGYVENNQTFANLLAFKQFKRDSIFMKHFYDKYDVFKLNDNAKYEFEKIWCERCRPKPIAPEK